MTHDNSSKGEALTPTISIKAVSDQTADCPGPAKGGNGAGNSAGSSRLCRFVAAFNAIEEIVK